MKVTQYIARFLKDKGIHTVFELQGGMITRIIDALNQEGGIDIVSMHHEQAAAMAADAYGRIKNKPGVALATSGPGATNLLTGIGNCFFDSVPAIFITGQVNTNEQKGDKSTRQIGFQETDIVAMAEAITKKAYAIKTKDEIPNVFEEAYQIAMSGRPGPVLIDIPMNIQNQEIEDALVEKPFLEKNLTTCDDFINKYINTLKVSKKPLLLIGRGIRAAQASELFKKFIAKFQIPVVTSLLGADVLPYTHPLRVGFIGTYGNRWANYALGSSDVLLVLGSRIDLRQTGADIEAFKQGKQIFHVDIDSAELNNRFTDTITLNTDLVTFFEEVQKIDYSYCLPIDWNAEIKEKREAYDDILELKNVKGINPNRFMHQLSKGSFKAKGFTTDVGNNQMWSAQSLELNGDQLFLSSGGMGAMGYSLPAAIGASIALNKQPMVCISGDGGFQINIQELETVKRNNLPIKIVILNNHCLGMIRQFQDSYFESRYQSTVWGYSAPDFTAIARAYGIDSFSIEKEEDINIGLNRMWEDANAPFLLNVNINIHTNVYPKMLFGNPLTKMEPTIE
ncbi:acetolactate synthase-1/2/3 large subunit [Capnocytophaga leadbetteri]|uniref:Acetolactate synthase-1/2/3 large subunit n=1 Tax=Capnocytophaga leadbetteri TaxID=327575 RepID=A0A2T5XSW3_9FLAO|nr:thiamine pyrophosphate-binding protein [Capnocytophaga leadbetteri]PTX03721.1 acetolactate synthase-1/2/3 large subunit [Capnocytophaga leadbetteri]